MFARLLLPLVLALVFTARAQEWVSPVRGSWVRHGAAQAGDIVLVTPDEVCEIVVPASEHTAVQRAADTLAGDIERITGQRPATVPAPTPGRTAITLATAPASDPFSQQWEAYRIETDGSGVTLTGSNFRGTAFAAYTLCERLGVDPLHHWTGYEPDRGDTLILRPTSHVSGPPTFKYRGLFHDDEDILPRPIDPRNGYPYVRGTVPDEWYERYFETALRLRMNQVAPFVRVNRPFHIQKLASDWGLYYTSHHYDILLSNPYGFDHFGLAQKRGVTGGYDYINNRPMVEKYWRAGVEENRDLDAIYPVGLRATDDYGYSFPPGTTLEEKARIYERVIADQVAMARAILSPDRTPIFHLTLYNEMMDLYRQGGFDVPSEVMLIWDDNGDGIMRALPASPGKWRHGVYYHLAFFGASSKQSVHTVTPMRIADEFRKIVNAGATEYMLLNVSEQREHVMETRMIADICWDAGVALAGVDPANRYLTWWSREYFGANAAEHAATAYRQYYAIHNAHSGIWYGSDRVRDLLNGIVARLSGRPFTRPGAALASALARREEQHEEAAATRALAAARMTPAQARFFFEHVGLGLLIDHRPIQAARALLPAFDAPDTDATWRALEEALPPLVQMEEEIQRAERPPFEGWYRPTWIRVSDPTHGWSSMNVHRPYEMLRNLLRGPNGAGYLASRPFSPIGGGTGEISGDLRGLAVNTNAGSPYYGWVYVCDRTGQANRVRIYRPVPEARRSAAMEYEDTGLSIRVNSSTAQFAGGVYAPMGVSIGDDDTVWIADFSERQIETAPPVPPSGNSVTATVAINLPDFDGQAGLPAGWTPGHPRNVHVRGPKDRAVVLAINNTSDGSATDNTVQKYLVDRTRNAVEHVFTHPIRGFAGSNAAQGATGYSAAMDPAGNVYVPLRAAGGEVAVEKLSPAGQRLPFPATAPEGAPDAGFPGIAFVADPTAPGGGYLYWSGRVSGSTRQIVHRFDLDGGLMDGLGGYFGSDILSGNVLGYLAADDTGALYARVGNTSTSANLMKITRVPPRADTGGPARSSPAIAGGVAYFGGGDGRLYAVETATLRPPAGSAFPVEVGAGVPGRPAVREAAGALHVFFTTSDGRVGRVGMDGSGLRRSPPLLPGVTSLDTTPIVEGGVVYAAAGNGEAAGLYRLDALTLDILTATPLPGAGRILASPARYRGSLYVPTDTGLFRITDTGGPPVIQAVAGAPSAGPPFVHIAAPGAPAVYAASADGEVLARNAITFTPVSAFGANGAARLDGAAAVSSGPYALEGIVYVGDSEGAIFALSEDDGRGAGPGGSPVFFRIGGNALPGGGVSTGLSAAPASDGGWNIVFGARNGLYYQVRADDPGVYRVTPITNGVSPPFNTVAGVDRDAAAEIIGNDDGRFYRIPRF